ncbi:MAG: oligosaccharide flippase family protein [Acidobacteriaceae bacterium]|nr:oligosaccharide flippase family protein [Acidobacteriaceae bacterium]
MRDEGRAGTAIDGGTELSRASEERLNRNIGQLIPHHRDLLGDVASVYGVQFANYLFPLITVPYLSRVLGPSAWGLLAMAQAFGTYGHLVVEYGFIYSATRDLAQASDEQQVADVVARVSAARLLLAVAVVGPAFIAWAYIPLFRSHSTLFWAAVVSEILKAALPNYYFYGIRRVAFASMLDISARAFGVLGVFFLVRQPEDAWKFFGLQGIGAVSALIFAHWIIYSRYPARTANLKDAIRMLRDGGAMFLFRGSHQLYSSGNAFILGLFAPAQAVGFYAGGEKINSAAIGLLSPLSTVIYPRTAGLAKKNLQQAARLTQLCVYAMLAVSIVLGVMMWFGASPIVAIILGRSYLASASVLKILSLRAPLAAWTYVLGFQWLLALGLERAFRKATFAAMAINFLLATCLATRFTYMGMAWVVVTSQMILAAGIYLILRRSALSPFSMDVTAEHA